MRGLLKPEKLVSLLAGLLGPPRINLLRERDFLVIPVQPFIHSFRVERYNLAIRQNLHMLYTSEKLNEILVYEENQKSIYLFLSQVSNGLSTNFFFIRASF